MVLTGVHFILIILGLDLILTEDFIVETKDERFLVETEDGMGWDKLLGSAVPTAEDLEKVKTHHMRISISSSVHILCSSAHHQYQLICSFVQLLILASSASATAHLLIYEHMHIC